MPTPRENESRMEFIARCIPEVIEDGTTDDQTQAVAICHSMWSEAQGEAKSNALKTLSETDDELRVGNYIVLFGGRDLQGEYFTAETDVESEHTKSGKLVVDWEHDLQPDGAVGPAKGAKLGFVDWTTAKRDAMGIWVERVLDRRNRYVARLKQLFDLGLIGSSSEALPGKAKVELDGRIVRWPLKRDTLTIAPAEPRMLTANVLAAVKSVVAEFPELEGDFKSILRVDATSEEPRAPVGAGNEQRSDGRKGEQEKKSEDDMGDTIKIDQVEGLDNLVTKSVVAALNAREKEQAEARELETKLNEAKKEAYEKGLKEGEQKGRNWRELPTYMRHAKTGSEGSVEDGPIEAFSYYVKTGDHGALKAMQEGTDCEGGYLVPRGFNNRIVEKLPEFSWIRQAGATIYKHRGDVFRIPKEGTEPALPTVTAEEGAFTTDSPTIEVTDVTLYKFTKLIKVSEELMEDDATNLVDFLVRRVAGAFGEAEGKYAATGTASSQPQGVMVGGTAGLTFDSTGNITADEIPELFYKLQSQYRARQSTGWAMHPDTEAYIRMIRDANNFAFPGGDERGGSIARGDWRLSGLYSRPVFNDDDFATMATGQKVICVGDFSYYALVEHPGMMQFKRLEELYAANGQIGLRWYKRWGSAVEHAEAFQYGTMA